ncbi:hypothetical protein NFI96_002733 [Prochilodus magdalenae]|nr:hypothetical protein NFI96_002733 [Prochilodus magdalenae]
MEAQYWIKSLIRGFMCLSGIIGNNWLGFCSLPRSRSQLRTNDILFVNLALSNLITNYMVDLPDTLDFTNNFLNGKRYCGAFNFCSDLSETSSIFTTLFITVFWHQKLVGSLKRGGAPVQMDSIRLVGSLLAGSWTVAVAFSVPHFFFASENSKNKTTTNCMEDFHSHEAKQTYELLYLICANMIPILGICFASMQITIRLLQVQKQIKGSTTAASRGGNTSAQKSRSMPAGGAGHSPGPAEAVLKSNAVAPGPIQGGHMSKARSSSSSASLLRAATSVVAVASIFLTCWFIHLVLSIISTVRESTLVVEFASYIGAVYTCIIPYIYLHGQESSLRSYQVTLNPELQPVFQLERALHLEMNAKEWMKSIIRGFMCLSGIIGNHWLGFRSLPKSRSQLRTNDVLFVNLALSNLITNYMVDLPDTLDFVKRWPMGKMYCGAFNFCSNLSETSSIFTTMFITVFWHQKLVGSLKRGGAPVQMDNVRLVAALLVGSWIAAVAFSLPHFSFVPANLWNESSEECVEYFPSQKARNIYETLYLTLANVVPIIGILFASIQIAVTLLQNQKRIRNTTRAGPRGGNPSVTENQDAGGNSKTTPEFSCKVLTSNVLNHDQTLQKSQGRSSSSSGNQGCKDVPGTKRKHFLLLTRRVSLLSLATGATYLVEEVTEQQQ